MAATKIIIAGGGIAGPVLAIFLKRNGYDPIVYERHDEVVDAGLSLMLVQALHMLYRSPTNLVSYRIVSSP